MSGRKNIRARLGAAGTVEQISIRRILLGCCASAALLWTAGPVRAQAAAPAKVAEPASPAPAAVAPPAQPFDEAWNVGSHSPSGLPFRIPSTVPTINTLSSGWDYSGYFNLELSGGDANKSAALFRQYRDLYNGFSIASFGIRANKPDEARYFELSATRLGRSDQSYGLRVGHYNEWQVSASYVGIPHVFTDGYHSLWDGVGTGNLVLRSPLIPGGTGVNATDNANVAAVAAGPEMTLSLTREKGSIRYDVNLGMGWKAYASYAHESRNGARPFGAVWGAGGGTAPMEISEPIDYQTHDMQIGVGYADVLNAVNLKASASMFRNAINTLTFQEPYRIPPAAGSTLPAGQLFSQGRFDLVPNNDAYNVSAEFTRQFPNFLDGRLTAILSAGTARQDDNLIPYTTIPGLALANVVGGGWDTTASLSRTSTKGRTDTLLGDVTFQVSPADGLSLTGKAHYLDNANKTPLYSVCNPSATYVDSNPLLAGNQPGGLTADGCTGVWGRLLNDGTGVNVLLGANTTPAGNFPIQTTPFSNKQYSFGLTADYRLPHAASLNASFEHEVVDRTYRERAQTMENRVSVGYVNNSLLGSSLRVSYQYAQRRGSTYVAAPNRAQYSGRLADIPTTAGTSVTSWAVYTNAGLRMYDVADRNQHTVNVRLNTPLGDTFDASLTALVRQVDYPDAAYGRRKQEQNSINLDLNYQPSASRLFYAAVGYQDGRTDQASIAQTGTCNIGQVTALGPINAASAKDVCPAPGGPLFPLNFAWTAKARDRNFTLGFGADQQLGQVRLNLNYTRAYGRSTLDYFYIPGGAIAAATAPLAGNGMPDDQTIQDALDVGLTKPVGENAVIGIGYRFESGDMEDWHYRGLGTTHVVTGAAANLPTAVILDSGPRDYRVHIGRLTLQWKF